MSLKNSGTIQVMIVVPVMHHEHCHLHPYDLPLCWELRTLEKVCKTSVASDAWITHDWQESSADSFMSAF